MSTVDIALVIFILIGAISGFRQGFLMELFSLAALLLGILGGFKLMGEAMVLLSDEFDINKTALPYVAFAVVFIAILVGVNLLGRLVRLSISRTFLGTADQAAGAGLGMLKAGFLLSVALWILSAVEIGLPEKWTQDSWLLPRIESFAPLVTLWIGEYIPFLQNIFT